MKCLWLGAGKMKKDQWHELCNLMEKDDGLPTWEEAQYWTQQKLYFWYRYLDITTDAMFGNPTFPGGLVYVDLFAGAGVCTLRDTGKRIPGSVLIAARMVKPFCKIIACEENKKFALACRKRLDETHVKNRCHVLSGDCNQLIDEVVSLIPPDTLTIAFIDPKGLDARFETIEKFSKNARVDFVMLFADAYDINRNVELYSKDYNSKLDQVLGPDSGWREKFAGLPNQNGDNTRSFFAEIYKDQLKRYLGYTAFGQETIKSVRGPLYKLIYASKHELGLKFWNIATSKNVSGQRELF
jgi:three-Cys-motif partner protein